MAGLHHAFFLVRRSDHDPEDLRRFASLPGDVELHDDVVRYMGDTLRWLPARDPARGEACAGLCLHGDTILEAPGARLAAGVFASWAHLLGLGPPVLELTGAYSWVDDPERGRHEQLRYDRDELCGRLRTLAALCTHVAQGAGEAYLLHSGPGLSSSRAPSGRLGGSN